MGIFASSFCMYVGEYVNIKFLKKELEADIRDVLDEMWIPLNFRNGLDRQGYIDNSKIIITCQNEIQRLFDEYTVKETDESKIISELDSIVKHYKAIYENEYMKNSNKHIFEKYMEELEKLFGDNLTNLYLLSEDDIKGIEIRDNFEKIIEETAKYIAKRNESTDRYIEDIKKIEKKLNDLYEKSLGIRNRKII